MVDLMIRPPTWGIKEHPSVEVEDRGVNVVRASARRDSTDLNRISRNTQWIAERKGQEARWDVRAAGAGEG
jgi:hypothetical protein